MSKNNSEMNIKNNLRKLIIHQIHCDLTIGREDNEEIPFTNEQIESFVNKNSGKIEDCINEIYNDYQKDNELIELDNPEDEWIREYLYEYISYSD